MCQSAIEALSQRGTIALACLYAVLVHAIFLLLGM